MCRPVFRASAAAFRSASDSRLVGLGCMSRDFFVSFIFACFLPARKNFPRNPGFNPRTLAKRRVHRHFSHFRTLARSRYREGSKIQLVPVSSAFPEGARVEGPIRQKVFFWHDVPLPNLFEPRPF